MDIARGIAIISVVLSHNNGFPFSVLRWFICPYYIALFFIISGFFDKGKFNLNRVMRLIAFFLGYTILLFVFSLADKSNQYPYWDRFMRALYGRYCIFPLDSADNIYMQVMNNHPMWFIPALVSSSILFWGILSYLKKLQTNLRLFVAVLVSLVLATVSYFFCFCPILLPWSLDTCSSLVIFMIFGWGLAKLKRGINEENVRFEKKAMIFIALAFIYFLLVTANKGINIAVREYGGESRIHNIIAYILIGMCGSLLCLHMCYFINQFSYVNIFLRFIGKHTIAIMCQHVYIWHFVDNCICNGMYRFFANIVLVVFLAWVDYYIHKYLNAAKLSTFIYKVHKP